MKWNKIVLESISQTFEELNSNRVRTMLSVLGVMIGVFCIISVKSAIGSLKRDITSSFESFGADVVYVTKMPWFGVTPEKWRKYQKRPVPGIQEMQHIKEMCPSASKVVMRYIHGRTTVKYKGKSVNGAFAFGGSNGFFQLSAIPLGEGRFFSENEFNNGNNVLVIGTKIAEELFGSVSPVGKEVKVFGQKFKIVGTANNSGGAIASAEWDECIFVPLEFSKKRINFYKLRSDWASSLMIGKKPNVSSEQLEEEIAVALRSLHKLRPVEENDFSLNTMGALSDVIDNISKQLNLVGLAIGIFSIFVGMFSLANILFVSVQERTRIIGVKKALGAQNKVILFEFMIEGIALCLIGGIVALLLIYGLFSVVNVFTPIKFFVSIENVIGALVLSSGVGLLASLIPALRASWMKPVEAMRK